MRFFASNLYFPPALRNTTTCKGGWMPLKGTIYNESLQDLEDNGVSVKAGVDTTGKSVQELQ